MNATKIAAIEDEVEKYDRLILAAEKWGEHYKKDLDSYAKTIKLEARYGRELRAFFREQSKKIEQSVNWFAYDTEVHQYKLQASKLDAAINVETIVSGDFYDGFDGAFVTVSFETISTMIANGAAAGEAIYEIPLGIRSTDAAIQRLTTERLAFLVGKKVDKNGIIIDNPNQKYRISDKTRKDINQAVKTNIQLGQDKKALIERLSSIVNDPKRAANIAQTESINAYAKGLMQFARDSKATGKEWEDLGATDSCKTNSQKGIVPLDYRYESGNTEPAEHNGCRCGLRIVYANEFNPDVK